MTGSNKDSLTEQKGKNMSGFFRKAQAESEIDAIVRNVCDAFRDEFGVETSVTTTSTRMVPQQTPLQAET